MHRQFLLKSLAYCRALRLLGHILYAALMASLYPTLGKATQQQVMKAWSRKLLKILNVSLHVQDHPDLAFGQGCLYVANHLSWLDVFVMNAHAPARFVAKSDVSAWPVFGWLVRRTGTLFIQRNRPRDTTRINALMAGLLQQGERVALFPQGTSSAGDQAVHFHAALLQGAMDAQARFHPVVIYYHDGRGQRRDDASFTGDMGLLQSLWKILSASGLQVTLCILPWVDSVLIDRRALNLKLQQLVNARLDQFRCQTGGFTSTS